jgi:hypothetical protein
MTRSFPILCILSLSLGCGTVSNMQGCRYAGLGPVEADPQPFGGAGNDIRWVGERMQHATSPDELALMPLNVALAGYYGLIDLPLSLVGDTLTLPQVLSSVKHAARTRQDANGKSDQGDE